MDVVIAEVVIASILIFLIMIGFLTEKNREKTFRNKMNREFSKPLDASYSSWRINAISGYYLRHVSDTYTVDDITWNDLNMDDFIYKFNHSYSSVGDEYLYYRLRSPYTTKDNADFDRLEELCKAFEEDAKKREDFQLLMAKLGRSGKFSLYSYLDLLSSIPSDQPVLTILDWVVYLVLIAGLYFWFIPALICLVIWIIVNIITYLGKKKQIEPYFVSFEYILKMMITAKKVNRLLDDRFGDEKKALKEAREKLSSISSNNLVFLQSSANSAVGDLGNGILDFFKMFLHLDIFMFYRMKAQVEKNTDSVDTLFETLGKLDFAVNILSLRTVLPQFCIPEFTEEISDSFEDMVHPLLWDCGIPNSITADTGILLTGSNASGKSTFLRMVALNAVLAQSMHTVFAKSYKAGMFRVFTSMSLKDSIEAGESYYMAEIKSIKRILDACNEEGSPVLCFVDEVLRGTNTKERIAAGAEIMKSMQSANSLCFAATHDIELSSILVPEFTNYHFDEEMDGDDIHFPYQLKEGYATSRNAIALLRIMGYPEDIVNRALQRANEN